MRFIMGGLPPWMMPFMQQQEEQHQPQPDMMIPPRVRQAMEFIALMTSKTQSRPAMTENLIEVVEGQKLTDEEAGALAVANNLIARYLAGQLKPDIWEQLKFDHMKKKADMGGVAQRIINCPACNPMAPPSPDCPLCTGSGKLLVQPCAPPPPQGGGLGNIMEMMFRQPPGEDNGGDPPDPPFDGPQGFGGVETPEPPQDK